MRGLLIALLLPLVPLAASGRDITGCHDAVLTGDTGVLQNDLDCGGPDLGRWGVTLAPRATLDLNGHAIRNEFGGVWCQGKCVIKGPGEISGMSALAVLVNDKTMLRDVVIRDSGGGVYPADVAGDLALLMNVKVALKNVTLARTGSGVYGWKIKARNVSVTDGAWGLLGEQVKGRDVTLTGNTGLGIRATKTVVRNLTATGNGDAGVDAYGPVILKDSTLSGNDGLGDGRDIISRTGPPVLLNTTCGRSALGDGTDWGVCAND